MQITFIGGGNMASAIIGGLYRLPDTRIAVVEPGAGKRADLSARFGVTGLEALPVRLSAADIVVLAVKPQQLRDVCTALAPRLNGALVISIAAGIGIAVLSRWLGGSTRIVRVMPNTPAMVGKGVSGLYADAGVTADDRAAAETIMRAVGTTLWLDTESGIDDITAVSGSGPAYVFYFIEALEAAARDVGFDADTARELALSTFEGAVALARHSGEPAGVLKQKVMSKGGTTERAIARFDAEGVAAAVLAGARDCRARSVEMGEEMGRD